MNKEVYYEGWLIKSPPTKRIWRARWRRRWFTLKQGEIPEQFCLEYYADRKCRKLKGVIDLDQCEQVDCGLRLENRKQKFQFMFDIKTPKRTYYLAADTEQDMRDWVNCICQVCHLHDTKQQQDESCIQNITTTTIGTNSSNDTTTTTLNTSTISSGCGVGGAASSSSSASVALIHQNALCDVLRKSATVIDQQPTISSHCSGSNGGFSGSVAAGVDVIVAASVHNNNDSAYINTEYTNRETLICDTKFEQQQRQQMGEENVIAATATAITAPASSALYLNAAVFQQHQQQQQQESTRLAVNANGVVRKIPENLILNNAALTATEQQQASSSVQPSPALSTASGPYIPISECFSGSPKFMFESNNPTTPLNNLDPKFYDTPRSHNNIGLNLTNDQSYSPKITNCGAQQPVTVIRNRNQQRSDSDSESVFTDDDEWTHPLPLREHLDRNTRPSDSSVENEPFVLTYSQRFSKLPEDILTMKDNKDALEDAPNPDDPEHLTKVLKNKNNLVLDIKAKAKQNEKVVCDLPQLSDTENTSPAFIGPKDAKSVVEESYDIPRSHQLPYYNMNQLLDDKLINPKDNNPIAASTPNLSNELLTQIISKESPIENESIISVNSASINVRTLPRAHCYTNAAPTKIEGNVFRYDFIEQPSDVPPVNRKLKPKTSIDTDKVAPTTDVLSELPAKTSISSNIQIDHSNYKVQSTQIQCNSNSGQLDNSGPLKPPSVDRKSKPNVFKIGQSNTLVRRSTGAYSSMMTSPDINSPYSLETHTLPRHPRSNYAFTSAGSTTPPHLKDPPATPTTVAAMVAVGSGTGVVAITSASSLSSSTTGFIVHHQRTASANAALQLPIIASTSTPISTSVTAIASTTITTFNSNVHTQSQINPTQMHNLNATMNQLQLQLPPKNEHKLQYFDLDVANAPAINRQSLSTSSLNISGNNRLTLNADPSARPPMQSGVVYNSVDFVKTEAFKRIREERKKENEGVANSGK